MAEHSLRVAVIGYVLANMSGKFAPEKIVLMCLFHDLVEARTGDLNYVNKRYVKADEDAAVSDMTAQLPFGNEIRDWRRSSIRQELRRQTWRTTQTNLK